MKLGSLKSKNPDGDLCIVSRDLTQVVHVQSVCPSLRLALENWEEVAPELHKISSLLNSKQSTGFPTSAYEDSKFLAALPRTWLFADGSAFIHHVRLVRQARGAHPPESLLTVPLMYQGESGYFLAPYDSIPHRHEEEGLDFEAEVGVITDFVPQGIDSETALKHIQLIVLINDISLRGLIPGELAQGFGFFQSKPASSLSPIALTPDELGTAWKSGRIHYPLCVDWNGVRFGSANAGDMHFHFGQLIAHAAKTRDLQAGTIIGSGTVSNEDVNVGSSCIVEKRMLEQIHQGKMTTPFLRPQDEIKIYMKNHEGQNLFGNIHQKVMAQSSTSSHCDQ